MINGEKKENLLFESAFFTPPVLALKYGFYSQKQNIISTVFDNIGGKEKERE